MQENLEISKGVFWKKKKKDSEFLQILKKGGEPKKRQEHKFKHKWILKRTFKMKNSIKCLKSIEIDKKQSMMPKKQNEMPNLRRRNNRLRWRELVHNKQNKKPELQVQVLHLQEILKLSKCLELSTHL